MINRSPFLSGINILIILVILFSDNVNCQILPFHHYTMKDGLISDNIHALCLDSLGYLWIGTGEGISVFDSKEFKNYSESDGLASENISCILASGTDKSSVWIGTEDNGIIKFSYGIFKNLTPNLKPELRSINTLFEDNEGNIWCGTYGGIFIIKKDSVILDKHLNSLGIVNAISGSGGVIWIGTQNGLYEYVPGEHLLKKLTMPGSAGNNISLLFRAHDQTVWGADWGGEVFKIDTDRKLSYIAGISSPPLSIAQDNDNNIWLSSNKGIFKIRMTHSKKNLTPMYTAKNGLPENNISYILFDRENILWAGTNDYGLSKLIYRNLFKFHVPPNYAGENWSTAVVDTNNHFWVSVKNGLIEIYRDNNLNWQTKEHSFPGTNEKILIPSVFCDNKNHLYVASAQGSIYIFSIETIKGESGNFSRLKLVQSIIVSKKLKYYSLYNIYVDSRNLIWISALDLGVLVIDRKSNNKIIKIYNQADGIPDNSVRAIYQDRSGNYWFGGYDHGISEFSAGKIAKDIYKDRSAKNVFVKKYNTANGLPNNAIRAFNTNAAGELLVGTRYGGLAKLSNGRFIKTDRKDGLISNGIWSISKYTGSYFWIGTQSGVQELRTSDNHPLIKLNKEVDQVPYYSVCSSKANDLCFVSNTDVYIYEPDEDEQVIYHPPVYIKRMLINGRVEKVQKNIVLGSSDNTITFDFIGIINREDKIEHYTYKLLNVDKEWNILNNSNSVTYASLSPGVYTLQVFAINSGNIKSRTPAEITFTIDAPYFEQWWFIVLVFAGLLASVVIGMRIKVKRLLEIEKIRTRIAADLHDEIGSGLTRIAILSEHALQEELTEKSGESDASEKYSKHVSIERVGKIARGLVDSMIDVIWSIDPKYDSLNDFIFNFKTFAYEVCEARNIKLFIETDNIENVKVNSQIKRGLQLISKEALNNSLKYSRCNVIKYSLSVKNKNVHLSLEDDGVGFDPSNINPGHGLGNIAKHARDLGGKYSLDTMPDKGMKIDVIFPVKS